jgi:hypothetical protein
MCKHCRALMINGVMCHEHGCPDAWKDHTRECPECGREFVPEAPDQQFCDGLCAEYYNG